MRHLKPTIFSTEDVKRVFELVEGPNVTQHEIRAVSIAGKLQRFGAQKCLPTDCTDPRGRLSVANKQTVLWTTDTQWVRRPSKDYYIEYMRLHKEFPEVFSVSEGKSKF